ncbi:hypothetical protein [Streptomyces sp. NPDC050704]|uniref:hypothetical protein n=1 Tax=Streptomyces sp. NPDC050704 TaxID=3157219 RepID=UPI003424EAEB
MLTRFGKKMAACVGAATLILGFAQTSASADTLIGYYSYDVWGRSTSGCSSARGTVHVPSVNTPVGGGAVATWAINVTDECPETGEAHLRVRYRLLLPDGSTYTTRWATVASTGTLDLGVGALTQGSMEFAVCDYTLAEGDHACGELDDDL